MNFSIVIPNLNSPTIDQTIRALEEQREQVQSFEIIVVGLDEPGLIPESTTVRFISSGNPVSPGMARSIGCRYATGNILCFLDADCIPRSDWLRRIAAGFQNPSVSVLGGGVECSENGFWVRCEYISSFHDYMITAAPGIREQLPSLNLIVRRSVFEQVGGFDETLAGGEDADLTIRLRANGHVLHFDPQVWVDHKPNRRTVQAVFRRTWWYAYHSMKIDPGWRAYLRPSLPLRHRRLLLVMSPLLALGITLKIFWSNRALWRWWYTAPAIFALKIMWCFGAADGMRAKELKDTCERALENECCPKSHVRS